MGLARSQGRQWYPLGPWYAMGPWCLRRTLHVSRLRLSATPCPWAQAQGLGSEIGVGQSSLISQCMSCPVAQVHAYVHGPRGRTAYLSELASGTEVVVVDAAGRQRSAVVGRLKVETRPLVRGGGLGASLIERAQWGPRWWEWLLYRRCLGVS